MKSKNNDIINYLIEHGTSEKNYQNFKTFILNNIIIFMLIYLFLINNYIFNKKY